MKRINATVEVFEEFATQARSTCYSETVKGKQLTLQTDPYGTIWVEHGDVVWYEGNQIRDAIDAYNGV